MQGTPSSVGFGRRNVYVVTDQHDGHTILRRTTPVAGRVERITCPIGLYDTNRADR